ncbi:MAG: fibronectin type III domain-containing protein [Ruminococcaceae bacterium]|jgi:hypothetical protein|nr:fibronectin type III domain-containing protein [Oscillospiraceae bacterium]
MKKIISIMLSLVMLFSTTVTTALTTSALAKSGKCGDNVTYTYDSATGMLTISGKGDMYSRKEGGIFSGSALKSVVINNGVTSIGEGEFWNCKSLKSVTLPKSLKSISNAFKYCVNLTSIKVNAENPNLDSRNDCNAVIRTSTNTLIAGCNSTVIPNTVTEIGKEAFKGCNFVDFNIPGNIGYIDYSAFSGCSNLRSITLQSGVGNIGEEMFADCSNLSRLIIPSSVKTIDLGAFKNCKQFIDIYYSGSQSDWKKINIVDGDDDTLLSRITIHYNCTVCAEHTAVNDNAVLPTCTEPGLTKGSHCSVCGKTLVAQTYVAAKGHKWNAGKITKQPTFKATGVKTYTCTVCKATKKVSVAKLVSPTVSKLTAGKKAFTVTYKKSSTVAGYQIQYATNSKFTKGKKTLTVKGAKNTKKTVKKLTAKKKYYVRVRAYKTINSKKVYSPWSKAKAVTTKK